MEQQKFTVKAGSNYCDNQLVKVQAIGNRISVDVYVNDTWIWAGVNGISKVVGIYWIHPHINSIRLGWDGDEFCYYAYKNGQSPQQNPALKGRMLAATEGWYHFDIAYSNGKYSITYADAAYEADGPGLMVGAPQLSLPHVGGNYTLDEDWDVYMRFN
jgi:hypothetical protein